MAGQAAHPVEVVVHRDPHGDLDEPVRVLDEMAALVDAGELVAQLVEAAFRKECLGVAQR